MAICRQLGPADEAMVDAFLATRADTTMFLRSNLRRAGFVYTGAPYEGTYAGAFEGEALVGVVGHFWNGNVIVAGGAHVTALVHYVVGLSRREVKGFLGPHVEVALAVDALGLDVSSARTASKEILYRLDLVDLVVPPQLLDGTLRARTPNQEELSLLLDWRMAYVAETMSIADTADTRAEQRRSLEGFHRHHEDILVTRDGEPVSYSGFNATLPDIVQVGGVWTPPLHRGRGYARSAVAASLVAARGRNVARAILFTGEGNAAANRAYSAIGFRPVGDYALVFFA